MGGRSQTFSAGKLIRVMGRKHRGPVFFQVTTSTRHLLVNTLEVRGATDFVIVPCLLCFMSESMTLSSIFYQGGGNPKASAFARAFEVEATLQRFSTMFNCLSLPLSLSFLDLMCLLLSLYRCLPLSLYLLQFVPLLHLFPLFCLFHQLHVFVRPAASLSICNIYIILLLRIEKQAMNRLNRYDSTV